MLLNVNSRPFLFYFVCSMKKLFFILFFSCICNFSTAQEDAISSYDEDSKYLEDQFYVGVAYNALLNQPSEVIQRNLSYNIQLGFIKDIPVNAKRNFGFGLGIGYATNSYFSNIIAEETDAAINYRLSLPADTLNRTKLETHAIEFPFEIRWRTSNEVDYKFWRVYSGVKAAYLFSRSSRFVSENSAVNTSFRNRDIIQWQYGLTLNVGYNTWNISFYYGLNSLLEDTATLNNEVIDIRPLRIGVIFYIL